MKNDTYNINNNILLNLYESKFSEKEKKTKYMQYLSTLRKLAYQGNTDAQYDLAQHYDDISFWGIPNPYYNVSKKYYWYSKAASNNHAAANNNLADMYERGEGCSMDIKKALELYKRAAELGDVCGKKNYKLLLKQIKTEKYQLE
jgi:TPR repeat protein